MDLYSECCADELADACVFIEPATDSLILNDTLSANGVIIEFSGKFYKNKSFPEGYESVEDPDKARVFRYTNFHVIRGSHID